MLFNSYAFILAFLPLAFAVYFGITQLPAKRFHVATLSKIWLLIASLFFYGWWNPIYLPLLVGSMIFNFIISRFLSNTEQNKRKYLLSFGILANLALLGYFKYADFFIRTLNQAINQDFATLNLALPLAISFFTFQQIAYLVDSYRKQTNEHNALNYAVFVSFFPQLIAGPIVHHQQMMPQFADSKRLRINPANICLGLYVLSIGLFKKVILADTFAQWANQGFASPDQLNTLEAWATSLAYTCQLYFDFSGYCDMAIGAALLFNIQLPINFNSPYKALNIQDFWRRWHITLSKFLRDYIYIPLGGNRKGHFRTYTNLMATFLIGGLWHGAGWTFIFWGFLHGLAIAIHRFWSQATEKYGFKLWTPISWLITFNFVNIAWIFFRATSWQDAWQILAAMIRLDSIVIPGSLKNLAQPILDRINELPWIHIQLGATMPHLANAKLLYVMLPLAAILCLATSNTWQQKERFKPRLMLAIFAGILFGWSLLQMAQPSEFLYFNF